MATKSNKYIWAHKYKNVLSIDMSCPYFELQQLFEGQNKMYSDFISKKFIHNEIQTEMLLKYVH